MKSEYNFNFILNNPGTYRRLMFGTRMFSGRIRFIDYGKVEVIVGGQTLGNTTVYNNIESVFKDWNIVDRRVLIEKVGHSL